MAVIKIVPQKGGGSVKGLSDYLTQEEKIESKQISEYDCSKDTIKEDFQAVKDLYNKTQGREYVHMVQSFKPGEVSVEEAHKVGQEMKDKVFPGYQVLLVTHEDKGHIHNHFVVNSVNMEDGHKWHQNAKDLYEIRSKNDEICKEHGLSVPEPNKNRYIDMKELKPAEKGESWKFKLMTEIDHAKNTSLTKEQFIENMNSRGYEVNWTDTRKNITYTTPEGQKCRDSKLPKEYSKEVMENEYRSSQGQEQTEGTEQGRSYISRDNERDSQEGSKDYDRGNDRKKEHGDLSLSGGETQGVERDPEERNNEELGKLHEWKRRDSQLREHLSERDIGDEQSISEDFEKRSGESKGYTDDSEIGDSQHERENGRDSSSSKPGESLFEEIASSAGNSICAAASADNQRDQINREQRQLLEAEQKIKAKERSRGHELEL